MIKESDYITGQQNLAQPQTSPPKAPPQSVGYQDKAQLPPFPLPPLLPKPICGFCLHYRNGPCMVVEGQVSFEGTCVLFLPDPSKAQQGQGVRENLQPQSTQYWAVSGKEQEGQSAEQPATTAKEKGYQEDVSYM